jgi:hypothetical protein
LSVGGNKSEKALSVEGWRDARDFSRIVKKSLDERFQDFSKRVTL